jgi:hypothetical protein
MEHLREWLLLPAERPTLRIELLLKLFFGHTVPLENMIQKVQDEKRSCGQILQVFARIEEHMAGVRDRPGVCEENITFGLVTLRYGQRYYSAVSQWCDETLEILKQRSGGTKTGEHEEE